MTAAPFLHASGRPGRRTGGDADGPRGRLFIIGSARSGTTILQNALNNSPDIFLLGEPDLHRDDGAPGFRDRYNAQHRSWSNQETKSTFLPPVLAEDGPWPDHLAWLARRYRWVGAKIVANAIRAPGELDALFALHAREFYDARYIFTFRDPFSVIASTRGLQVLSGGPVEPVASLAGSYAAVIALYMRMSRNLPFVRCLFHAEVRRHTFRRLEDWLGAALDGAFAYYDAARVRRHSLDDLTPQDRVDLGHLSKLYADLRTVSLKRRTYPQLEQNDANPDLAHYTLLGSIDRRARMLAASWLGDAQDPA